MLHLLPEYQKRKVLTEYRMRLTVVCILLVAVAILAYAIFLMPSYVYLFTAKSELTLKKEGLMALIKAKSAASADKSGGDIGKAIAALKPLPGSLQPLQYMDVLAPSPSFAYLITVNGYFMTPTTGDKIGVVLNGVAVTREGLTKYVAFLNDRFGGVKLPLSALAKQSDIPFEFRFEVDRAKFQELIAASSAAGMERRSAPGREALADRSDHGTFRVRKVDASSHLQPHLLALSRAEGHRLPPSTLLTDPHAIDKGATGTAHIHQIKGADVVE